MMMPHSPIVGIGAAAPMTKGADMMLPLIVAGANGPPTGPKLKVSSALLVFFCCLLTEKHDGLGSTS